MNRSWNLSLVICSLVLFACTSSTSRAPSHPHGGAPVAERSGSGPDGKGRNYPGTLRPPRELGADFQWRQRVTARWPEGAHTFEAVLTKDGQDLMLLGLGPLDTPGFILTLDENGNVEMENRTGRPIPFEARYVLLDVQRTFYPWFSSPHDDGTRQRVFDGERITEQWKQGRLQRRTFTRVDGQPPGQITVTYEGWTANNRAPARARLDNGWFGYVLEISTISQQTL